MNHSFFYSGKQMQSPDEALGLILRGRVMRDLNKWRASLPGAGRTIGG
jgi:hypothetical protein